MADRAAEGCIMKVLVPLALDLERSPILLRFSLQFSRISFCGFDVGRVGQAAARSRIRLATSSGGASFRFGINTSPSMDGPSVPSITLLGLPGSQFDERLITRHRRGPGGAERKLRTVVTATVAPQCNHKRQGFS